jgi:phosphoglycolate phosphatase-like HAD superfamily hydrolase
MGKRLHLANFETLIWDLDGTILDSYKISLAIWTELFKGRGIDLDVDILRRNYHGTLRETCEAIIPSSAQNEIDDILVEFIARDNAHMQEDVNRHLFQDAVDLIERAHNLGRKQIIVTNRAHGDGRINTSPHTMIGKSKINHCIYHIICGDEVEERKPNVRVLNGIDYNPETTLVIGDQHVDAHFAHNINAKCLIVGRHPEIFEGVTLPGNHSIVESLNSVY